MESTIHKIKINHEFVKAILEGDKNFEIRENDRGYQKGDLIQFRVKYPSPYVRSFDEDLFRSELESSLYEITYVINGWGLKDGYVVFGIRKVLK